MHYANILFHSINDAPSTGIETNLVKDEKYSKQIKQKLVNSFKFLLIALLQIYEIGHIATNLRISVLQAEEESERIAEDFVEGMKFVVLLTKCFKCEKKNLA